jgi:signal transduction histidine kinase
MARDVMLYEFIDQNRDAIISGTRDRVRSRPWPSVAPRELEDGVPLFLTQLSETLRLEAMKVPFPPDAIGAAAARHGGDLVRLGFTLSQVVHDYGDICQTITALAVERRAPISVEEFHTLNRCLDTAIAEAVTERARVTAEARSTEETERLGHMAHELRDTLNTAILAFHALKRGAVAINGSAGAILGRSLMRLREVIDGTLSEVRLEAGKQRPVRLPVVAFIDEIAATGLLHSEYRKIQFTLEPIDPALSIDADAQLLTSAVMNLLHNAFKKHAVRRARRAAGARRRSAVTLRDGRRVWRDSGEQGRSVSSVWQPPWQRPVWAWPRTLDRSEGGTGTRWRHPRPQYAGQRLYLCKTSPYPIWSAG